jgi:hypothetical protein
VFAVAITELAGGIDAEATALASDLAVTAYEARMLLAPGMPAVVRTTPDRALALDLLARLRARGHDAVACDTAAVVASSAMLSMRRFRLGPEAITLDDHPEARLAYADILALTPAVHRRRTDVDTQVRETKFSATRAIVTSGLSMTKTTKKDTHSSTEERTAVLYVFPRGTGTPWLLSDRGTSWAGHGRPVAHSEAENYRIAVAALRERAPGAAFDDRLVARKATPERVGVVGGAGSTTVKASSEAGVDLLAHLLALWLRKREQAAYR